MALRNKEMATAYKRKYIQEHKERMEVTDKHQHLMYDHGLSLASFNKMLSEQGNKCAICRRLLSSVRKCVDHDHKTNQIRGILCLHCNTGLGNFQDSPKVLKNAIEYLKNK